MKNIFKAVAALPIVIVSACDLDLYPETVYNEGNVFIPKDTSSAAASQYTTGKQMANLVNGFYSNTLKSNIMQEGNFTDWLMFTEVRADNAYNGSPNTSELVWIESNNIDGSNKNVGRDWDYIQNGINAANQVICNADRILKIDPEFTEDQRNLYVAQANIMKAFFMLRGSQLFGTIPVLNTIPPAINAENVVEVYPEYYPPRASKQDIYTQMKEMLEFAAGNAPDLDPANKFKLSKTFAKSLLAHIYAEKSPIQDWEKVKVWCEAVETDMGVDATSAETLRSALCENYKDMWSYDVKAKTVAQNTKESIFEVTWTATSGNWTAMMFHRNQFNPSADYTWSKWCTPSRNLIAAYDAENDTERKNVNILWDACTWSLYYPETEYAFMGKMETNATSFMISRLGEIYLLHAEALAELGDIEGARKYVNAIRLRAKLDSFVAAASKEEMIDKVLDERRLELAFEGYRFFDLARHDKIIEVHNTVWQDDPYYIQREPLDENSMLYPVPTTILNNNPNIQQNPGY